MCAAFSRRLVVALVLALSLVLGSRLTLLADDAADLAKAIERGRDYLIKQQVTAGKRNAGSWTAKERENFRQGITALVVLTLLETGLTVDDKPLADGVKFLREAKDPTMVYEASLKLMALAQLNDDDIDRDAIATLAQYLQSAQIKADENSGSWSYNAQHLNLGGDRSNAQFAVAALAAARRRGANVASQSLKAALEHFDKQQSADAGWSYQSSGGSTGSMTTAGVASTCLLESAIPDGPDRGDAGAAVCCLRSRYDTSLMRAHDWLTRHFSVRHNPKSQSWLLYYVRELEIASSAHGVRFYGSRDWYRDGTEFLLAGQSQRDGSWRGDGLLENDPVVGTCFALLFLTRGNAPVLFFKLDYEADAAKYGAPRELGVLTDHISGSAGWPRHVVWQRLGLNDFRHGDESVVHEAPILFVRGEKAPEFRDEDLELFKTYVERGGTIFAQPACGSKDFDQGFRALVAKLYPDGQLARLKADHPIFSIDAKLDADAVELHGLEVAGKTRIFYAPQDLACLWSRADEIAPERTDEMRKQIEQALQTGINVATYATRKELHGKIWSRPAAAQ